MGQLDVTLIYSLNSKSTQVETENPLDVDTGYLTVTDPNPIDTESYEYV